MIKMMMRSATAQNLLQLQLRQTRTSRTFHFSSAVLKKGKKVTAAEPAESTEVTTVDLDALKTQLENSKRLFAEKIKETKTSSLDQKRFMALPVNIQTAELPLGQLATIATRGTKLSIVAYDPKNLKHIRSAIIGQLGVPAQESANDAQTLSVDISAGGAKDKQAEIQKQLKNEFEHFKGSASRHSLSSIRTKYLNSVKKSKAGKSQQDQKKEAKQVEDLIKTYQTQFQEMARRAQS